MIRHNDEFVQSNVLKLLGDLQPQSSSRASFAGQPHLPFDNLSKRRGLLPDTYRHEVVARIGIVVSRQSVLFSAFECHSNK